jgi:hypothetical protein
MGNFEQIIVGAGASALTFLHFTGPKANTVVFGGAQMWDRMQQATHGPAPVAKNSNMPSESSVAHIGQPPSLSHAPQNMGAPVENLERLTLDRYNRDLASLKGKMQEQGVEFKNETVGNIKRTPDGYQVTTSGGTHTAKTVVLASGPGGSRKTPVISNAIQALGDQMNTNGYPFIVSAEEYLFAHYTGNVPKRVVVNGGSATSAWAVKHALFLGAKEIAWVTRSNFEGANPGGWNAEILLAAAEHKMMKVADVKSIEKVDKELKITLSFSADSARFTPLPLHASFGRTATDDTRQVEIIGKDQTVVLIADQYIYALGYDFGPTWALVDQQIKADMRPMNDVQNRFSGDGSAVVALHDGKGFWLVGAGLYNAILSATDAKTGFGALKGQDIARKFQLIPMSFCRGAQPNEGIPSQIASIGAAADTPSRNMVFDFNWNTANRRDIRWFFFYTYHPRFKATDFTRLEAVADKIIERRTKQLLPWKKEIFNVVAVECLQDEFKQAFKPPYPDKQFDCNNWGIDDFSSLLVQRYYPSLQEIDADKLAAAVMAVQWPSERVANPGNTPELSQRTVSRRGVRSKWEAPVFNGKVIEQAARLNLQGIVQEPVLR